MTCRQLAKAIPRGGNILIVLSSKFHMVNCLSARHRISHYRRRGAWLLFAGLMVLAATVAYADDWRERAHDAVANAVPPHQQCVLYAEPQDGRLHVRIPVCFYLTGDVYMASQDGYLTFSNRKAGATHPAVQCAGIVESAERVDPTTFLVRIYCQGATPERETVSVQLIDDTISIRNTEAY